MNIEFFLGLDFSGYYIRLIEVKRSEGQLSVTNIDQIKTEVDFHDPHLYEMISDPDIALHIVSNLTKMLNRNKIQAKKVSVSLSASSALLLTIPIDYNITAERKRESLLWEVSNYYPLVAPENFNIALFPMKDDIGFSSNLLIAIHKDIVLFIKNILGGLGLNAVQFDIDHFAALKSTVSRAMEMARRNYSLIGFRGKYIDIGKVQEASLSFYSGAFMNGNDESALDLLKSFLKDKIEEPCYFYGQEFTPDIISSLAKFFNLRLYGVLDPFQAVEVPGNIDLSNKFLFNQSDFAFAVGAVLKLK